MFAQPQIPTRTAILAAGGQTWMHLAEPTATFSHVDGGDVLLGQRF
jgi:hypothetical protein